MNPVELERAFAPLLGLRLLWIGRAADMARVAFESDRFLHIQCPWRLEGPRGVVTGRRDLWLPADPDESGWLEKSYDELPNLRDARLEAFHREIAAMPEGLRLTGVRADAHGGLDLDFSGGWKLQVFPDSSRGENWRLFRKGDDHFVVPPEE